MSDGNDNMTSIVQSLGLLSSTKDSLHVRWHIYDEYSPTIHGYRVRYQAEGSSIVQKSETLRPGKTDYDILQLHENTYYKICIDVMGNVTSQSRPCIRATTSVDSLSVALGSTFGAFLALGFIVLCVFLAKWTHSRKMRKHLRHVTPSGELYDSMTQPDGDIEMSDVSLQVNDGTVTADATSSQSSQVSGQPPNREGKAAKRSLRRGKTIDREDKKPLNGSVTHESPVKNGSIIGATSGSDGKKSDGKKSPVGSDYQVSKGSPTPPQIGPPPSGKKRVSRDLLEGVQEGSAASTAPRPKLSSRQNTLKHMDSVDSTDLPTSSESNQVQKDYGGARPKEYSSKPPLTKGYTNAQMVDLPPESQGLRHNTSCKW